jgi:hypothetical protein
MANAGFPQLAEKYRAIRPAPILPVTADTPQCVTSDGTYGVFCVSDGFGYHLWEARKWD